jgi:hypothetical protein
MWVALYARHPLPLSQVGAMLARDPAAPPRPKSLRPVAALEAKPKAWTSPLRLKLYAIGRRLYQHSAVSSVFRPPFLLPCPSAHRPPSSAFRLSVFRPFLPRCLSALFPLFPSVKKHPLPLGLEQSALSSQRSATRPGFRPQSFSLSVLQPFSASPQHPTAQSRRGMVVSVIRPFTSCAGGK